MKYVHVVSIAFFLMTVICLNLIAQDQPPFMGPAAERIEQFKKVRLPIPAAAPVHEEFSLPFQLACSNLRIFGNRFIRQFIGNHRYRIFLSRADKSVRDVKMYLLPGSVHNRFVPPSFAALK